MLGSNDVCNDAKLNGHANVTDSTRDKAHGCRYTNQKATVPSQWLQYTQYTQSLNLYQMKSLKSNKIVYTYEQLERFVF